MATSHARLRIGVAGLGTIARTAHLPMLERRADLFEIAAVSDLSPTAAARLGARYGVEEKHRHTDAGQMLAAGGLDAVLLLTSGSHGRLAAQALTAGVPVFCEKPLALTLAETAELTALTAGDDTRLMVGYMKQYDPAVEHALRELDRIGGPEAVHAVEVTVLHPSGDAQLAFAHLPAVTDVPAEVLAQVRADDVALVRAAVGDDPGHQALYRILVNSLSHDLSLLRMLTGTPSTVDHATTWRRGDLPEPSVEVAGSLPHGGRYQLRWHYLPDYPAYRETVTLHHERGTIELVFPSPYLMNAPTRLTTVTAGESGALRSAYTSVEEAFERELAAFHAMVTEGRAPRTGVAAGTADLVTAQRIVRRHGEQAGVPAGGEAGA
ncbi:MAG: Gfo/Idh/MocA family oxidoreductase [Hamadaea sp.]|nr:Gfo/Idh/MocA family oxidoreductase [Hamadaea sp.]